jgi:PilZ domain-containing protein
MEVTMPVLSERNCPVHEMEPRRDVRKVVELRMVVVDNVGLASGEVTNISPGGCGLRLMKRLRCGQYITLMVYPNDGTAAVHIDLAKVKWVEAESAGVEFLCVCPQNHELHRLCGDQVELPVGY